MWLAAHNVAGLLTDLLGEVSPIQPDVCFVTKRRRTSSTFLLGALLLDSSGSLFSGGLVSARSLLNLRMLPLTTGGRWWKFWSRVTYRRG